MRRANLWLLVLFAVQATLIVLVWAGREAPTLRRPRPLFPGLTTSDVTRVVIDGAVGEAEPSAAPPGHVELVRAADGAWTLASHFGYAADAERVEAFLGRVVGLSSEGPLTTRRDRHAQLGVADGRHERRVVLSTRQGELVLTLGSSPSLRRANLRVGAEDAVHLVSGLAPWDASDEPRGWIEPQLVDLSPDRVSILEIENRAGAFVIRRIGEDLAVSLPGGAPLAGPLDVAAAEDLLRAASRVSVDEPAGASASAQHGLDLPRARVTLTVEEPAAAPADEEAPGKAAPAGTVRRETRYEIGAEVDGRAAVRRDGTDFVVWVPAYALRSIVELTQDQLVERPAPPDGGASGPRPTKPQEP